MTFTTIKKRINNKCFIGLLRGLNKHSINGNLKIYTVYT